MAKYKIGDKVRVKADLKFNVENVQDFLGQICIVEDIDENEKFTEHETEYYLRLNDEHLEPFNESEIEKVIEKGFNVYTLTSINEEDIGTYDRWHYGLTMFIEKDGVSVELNEHDIIQIVNSLPRQIRR